MSRRLGNNRLTSGATPFILPLTVALADMEVWLVRMFQLVFLNLPETREERFRRKVRREVLCEIRREEEKRRIEAEKRRREAIAEAKARGEAKFAAWVAPWYARMKEAQEKGEPFDEPPPWEQQAHKR